MPTTRTAVLLVTAVAATGCGVLTPNAAPRRAAPIARPAPRQEPAPPRRERIAPPAATRGRAAVMVRDLRTGAECGHAARTRFVAASVMKVAVLTGLLIRRGGDGPTPGERDLADAMIRYSDNGAADALYARIGQGTGLGRIVRDLGLTSTTPYPTRWGASLTTPADQVRLLAGIARVNGALSPAGRRLVRRLMGSVSRDQAWGVSAAARKGERVELKNGWTPLRFQGSGWAVNSVGRVTGPRHDFVVAAFSADQPTLATGIRTVEDLATRCVEALRRPPMP